MTESVLSRVRALCLALPEATERVSHGEPAWFVRRAPQFAMFANRHHDDRVALWAAAPDGARDRWLSIGPDRFFVPPYVGTRGWIGVYLDVPQFSLAGSGTVVGDPVAGDAAWEDLAEIVEDAYRAVAPATLLRVLDARGRQ
ncbi:MmcQ/YjbR family DNA-binding protein [Rhodococcus sp. HNM0569]|uniref:MmcQ/YjbR family DNA-binding protein n=1 Tax=Rhodococcus sp. HNM0569 TaxID=2716340 RepID=UPI00146A0AD3|nr:MmcQ/YjbR family DNA-binding protein [Rhodococcus sp. HNM0569]NLU82496.1 MmcQ/YjbR family DNA-binding protein [Rhodococcus sp. HNM0569]